MIPSVQFVIVLSSDNSHNARPEELHHRALLASVICPDKCTANAKTLHAKSSTYEAKFQLMCKSLQEDVPVSWLNTFMWPVRREAWAVLTC